MSNNPTTTIPLTDETVDVIAGRTTTFSVGENVASVKVLQGVENGNVTANPDGTLAVVMSDSDYTGPASFIYQVEYSDGRIETSRADLNLVPGVQEAGWGLGDFMLLETDENDRTVIEHGDNHRKVHISGSEDALSRADIVAIAEQEGTTISTDRRLRDWLKNHPEYGATPEMAVAEDVGAILYSMHFSGQYTVPNSNWLLFEKGYEYSGNYGVIGVEGESALHPILISSYGSEGEATLTQLIRGWNKDNLGDLRNVVIQDLNIEAQSGSKYAINLLSGENILFDDANVSGGEVSAQNIVGFTFRNSSIVDAYLEESIDQSNGIWDFQNDRISGLYLGNSHGVILENSLIDHAGWGDGYDYNLSENAPHAPSDRSHNIYIQFNNTDVTLRDNIIMRGASFGTQVRSGGFIEDNVFLDNDAAVSFNGGVYTSEGLCCTNPEWDSSRESSVVVGLHEQLGPDEIQDNELVSLQ